MSERMNKERAIDILKTIRHNSIMQTDYTIDDIDQALDIAIDSLKDEVEELEKMESKALEDYSEEAIKKAVSKFSKTIKQINNRIQGKDNEWIDVRDRLPSEDEKVLVCLDFGNYKEIVFATCEDNIFYENIDGWSNDRNSDKVIAWKPLPKPYERKE